MDVVRFGDRGAEFRAGHHCSQTAVEAEHQIDAQTEVRCVEERPALLAAEPFGFGKPVVPAGGAAYDGRTCADAACDVVESRGRRGEFQRHVRTPQMSFVQVAGILLIDPQRDFVAAFLQDPFDLASHFSVSDNRCSHFRVV